MKCKNTFSSLTENHFKLQRTSALKEDFKIHSWLFLKDLPNNALFLSWNTQSLRWNPLWFHWICTSAFKTIFACFSTVALLIFQLHEKETVVTSVKRTMRTVPQNCSKSSKQIQPNNNNQGPKIELTQSKYSESGSDICVSPNKIRIYDTSIRRGENRPLTTQIQSCFKFSSKKERSVVNVQRYFTKILANPSLQKECYPAFSSFLQIN